MSRDGTSHRSVEVGGATTDESSRRTTFGRQVRDALTHLYDPVYLQIHPLARFVALDPDARSPGVGKALRQILLDAIESLHPLTGTVKGLSSGTGYQILRFRYVEALEVPEIQNKLALGKSEYYREQQRGLDAVVSLLWDGWRANQILVKEITTATSAATAESAEPPPTPPRHNLPAPTTTYIARAGELARVEQRLWESRLLTITGSGGCGKTRLALEVARGVLDEFGDGVWLVELAPLTDPLLVPQAIATALDVRETPGRPILATLTDYLRHRQTLLTIDNCEHLIDACAQAVETLLHACHRLRILATSREMLGVAGETTWRVSSLSIVDPRNLLYGEDLVRAVLDSEAARLFSDRARLVAPSFAVTDQNALAVAQVCQRLDGIPLALELAAARVAVLSVDQIAARLDQRFRLLTGGHRTALRRQQTLRAAIDWSYQLLVDDERALLGRLAVFVGGWSLEAAEAITAHGPLAAGDVLDLLGHLVAKSMVVVEEPRGDDRRTLRYRLSETIRQYAEEKLLEAGEAHAVRTRHRDYFAALAAQAEPELMGPNLPIWLELLDVENDNLRAALEWSQSHEPAAGLRLASAIWRFWRYRNRYEEGRRWLTFFLVSVPPLGEDRRTRAWALAAAGVLAREQADRQEAEARQEEALALFREFGDQRGIAQTLRELAVVCDRSAGDRERARALTEESLAVARAAGDLRGVGISLTLLAGHAARQGDVDRARSLAEDGLDLVRQERDPWIETSGLWHLGKIAQAQGDLAPARTYFEGAMAIAHRLGDKARGGQSLLGLAWLAWSEGNAPRARELLARSIPPLLEAGTDWITDAFCVAGVIAIQAGQPARGTRLVAAATRGRPIGDWALITEANHDDVVGAERENQIAAARAALGDDAFSAAWAEGQAMTLEEAVEVALGEREGATLG